MVLVAWMLASSTFCNAWSPLYYGRLASKGALPTSCRLINTLTASWQQSIIARIAIQSSWKQTILCLLWRILLGKAIQKSFPLWWDRGSIASAGLVHKWPLHISVRACSRFSNHSISFSSSTRLGFRYSAVSCFTRRRGRDTMEIFFGFISAACDRRPGGRWRRSRSLTTLLRVKSHSFPRQTTSTAPFSTAASCPPPFPFCRRPTLPLPFLRQPQSFILSLSVSLSPPAPICTFPFHSFFVSPCSILSVTKHKKLRTPTPSWNSIYTPFHVVLASEIYLFCFSSSRLIRPILCLISTQPLCSVNPAMSLSMSVPNNTLITSFREHDKVRFFTTMTMTMGPNLGLLNQSKALLKARQTPELRAFA